MKINRWSKQLKTFKAIILFTLMITSFSFIVVPQSVQACGLLGWGLLPKCWGKGAGEDAAKELRAAIEKVTEEEITFEFGVDDQDIQTIADRTRGLVGYATLQGKALISHGGEEYRESLSYTMNELENYTKTLNEIAEQRIDQLDRAAEARIRQTLEGIERQTLLISSEMKSLILATEEAVKSSAYYISDEVQEITRTASDELAELLGITRDHVDQLLDASEEKLLTILSIAGDEVAELVKLVSEETQKNIKLLGEESRETTIVALDKSDEVVQSILEEGGNELRVILDDIEGTSRVLLADSAGHAIDVTDNLSDETQEVIEVGAENLEELASHMAEEVLRINEAIKESRLQVIEGGLFFIDRTADLILAVGSTGAGIFFLFFSSYGFARIAWQRPLPENYTQKVIVFSFTGLTIVASFVPFVFSIPSMRARILIPMAQAKSFSEVVPGIGERIPREPGINSRQEPFSNNIDCYILATAHVRSEPSINRGDETVIAKGSKKNPIKLDVTGKQTAGGWIEGETTEGQKGWVYESVISNYEDMRDCVDDNEDIDVAIVPDIIPPKPPTKRSSEPSDSKTQNSTQRTPEMPLGRNRDSENTNLMEILDLSDFEMEEMQLSSSDIRKINKLTDRSFYKKHQKLNGRPIMEDETDLKLEWLKIKKCKVLVDYLFRRNHPELNGRELESEETELVREWKQIRTKLNGCN